ncbi:MAG: two component LuxR family transcriptional regulator [Chthonomonadales bacterium]|nr:two component LuxR family transcriptional regulator [Chthonomonadales bacterium]
MGSDQKIRVLVADCNHLIREGLATLLSYEPDIEVVGDAAGAPEAIELFREHRPDIALIDLRMNGGTAVEAIETLRTEFPDGSFLVLATFPEDWEIVPALKAGAVDCLLKDTPREQIVDVIRAVYAGERPNYFLQHLHFQGSQQGFSW